jgi:hypothetical protein
MTKVLTWAGTRRALDAGAIEITCDDCGRTKLWTRATLAAMVDPATTLDELGARLFCSACRLRGGGGFNICLRPRAAARAARG